MNQELIKRLAAGEIAYKPNSVDDEHFYTITDACGCPRKTYNSPRIIPIFFISGFTRIWLYYNDFEIENRNLNLPIYTTEQFFEVETETTETISIDQNPTQKMFEPCHEYRPNKTEFFLKVCANTYNQKVENHLIIKDAFEFTEMVFAKINQISNQ